MATKPKALLIKVRILTSFSGVGFAYTIGDVVELEADFAQSILVVGFAEEVK